MSFDMMWMSLGTTVSPSSEDDSESQVSTSLFPDSGVTGSANPVASPGVETPEGSDQTQSAPASKSILLFTATFLWILLFKSLYIIP